MLIKEAIRVVGYLNNLMNVSPELKTELERRARQTKDRYEHTRLCVILARTEGMSLELIAQAHRISLQSVYRYLEEYEREEKRDIVKEEAVIVN